MLQLVLDTVRTQGPISRPEIAKRLGVSKPTVSSMVQTLLRADLVVEDGLGPSSGGRPAILIAFNARAGFVIGMDIGGSTARAGIADLNGNVLKSVREDTDTGSEDRFVEQLRRLKARLIEGAPVPPEKVLAVAIGTPGVIDPNMQVVRHAPNLPLLEAPGLIDRLRAALGTALFLHNDVNLAALGERWRGAGRGVDDFAFVSIGSGLGFGLVMGGQLYQGCSGRAGEFGYTPVFAGAAATIEDVVAGPGIGRAHREAGGSGRPEDAFDEADAGIEPGASVIAAFLEQLGWLLAALSTLLDPSRLVLGGGIGRRCASHLAQLRDHVSKQTPFGPDIMVSHLEDDAGLIGAFAVALEESRPLLVRDAGVVRMR